MGKGVMWGLMVLAMDPSEERAFRIEASTTVALIEGHWMPP